MTVVVRGRFIEDPVMWQIGFDSMVTIRLQMKTHTLPKGGRVAQYTTSIPKDMVSQLGWKKGEKIAVEVKGNRSILLKKSDKK